MQTLRCGPCAGSTDFPFGSNLVSIPVPVACIRHPPSLLADRLPGSDMPTQTVTVLSVRQPWASLLLTGEDWCENRSWTTHYRGPLWIHASSKIDEDECRLLGIDSRQLVTGAILGVVEVVDVVTIDQMPTRQAELIETHHLDSVFGPEFVVGEFCWIVTNPRGLRKPIAVKGKLNLWRHEVDSAQLADLQPMPPLISRKPEPDSDDPDAEDEDDEDADDEEYADNYFIIELDDGSELELEYFLTEESPTLHVEFLKQGEVRPIARNDSDPEYVAGSEIFQIACELAWDEFPDLFN